MARKVSKKKRVSVEAYSHADKKRKNNPPVGLVSSQTDKLNGITKYAHDPHIDPYLSWAGKQEGNEVNVRNLSLHIHERIDPMRIVKSFLKEKELNSQPTLFDAFENKLTLSKAFDFYHHTQDWTNRLIAGDSLLVMNSLLQKEGMAGGGQTIFIAPPYGIKYNSNFQPFVNKREVKDKNDADIPGEPEMIHAFKDTWKLEIHSYLTYLRDRLLLSRELLTQSGSCFVQINDENLHHIKELMDEVFGKKNFVRIISFQKTSGQETNILASTVDYLVWYAKDIEKIKYRQLYEERNVGDTSLDRYDMVLLSDGSTRRLSSQEIKTGVIPEGGRRYQLAALYSEGSSSTQQDFEFEGVKYRPRAGTHWKTTVEGLKRLAKLGRIEKMGTVIRYRRFVDDFPVIPITDRWESVMLGTQKRYVVETSPVIVQRCILMTSDPGDLVLDPTCGSGTTAYMAEQWGRRWITCATSRVAIALAKQRLLTAYFPYYQLAHSNESIASGFSYKKVSHTMLGTLAKDEKGKEETLYDQPSTDKNKIRITGPFTTEAVPGLRVKPFDGSKQKIGTTGEDLARTEETANQATWRDELKTTGIRAIGGKIINFSRIEPMAGTRFLHAAGEILEDGKQKKALISFGPDYGALEQRHAEEAINEARALADKPDFLIFAAFHFDPEASKDIDQADWKGVKILKAQMSVDLLTADLRKNRSSNQSYWLIGQPDVEIIKNKDGTYKVKVNGFDYYNPITGEIDAGDTKRIAMWMLDTDYDEQSIMPEQVFFPLKDEKRDWTNLAKTLNGAVNEEVMNNFVGTESLPFKAGEYKKVAVKIIDDRGIESFVIRKL